MSNTETRAEIGVALTVNAESSKFLELFQGLGQLGLQTIDQADAHVTVLYPEEMAFKLSSVAETEAYQLVEDQATELLEQALECGSVLRPSTHEVGRLGHKRSKVGLFIAEGGWLSELRESIRDVYSETMGRNTAPLKMPYQPHITLGVNRAGIGKANKKLSSLRVPRDIHVVDFVLTADEWEHTQRSQPSAPKNDRNFRNRPRGDVSRYKRSA